MKTIISKHFVSISQDNIKPKKFGIPVICVGNIYLGGTGKTSLSLKIHEILDQKKIKSCFIKKDYSNQIDEQKILQNKCNKFAGKLLY